MTEHSTLLVRRSPWSGRPIRSDSARVHWLRSIGLTERHRDYRCNCAYCDAPGLIRINKGYSTTARMLGPGTGRFPSIPDCMCIDHVIPLVKGGVDDGTNFVFACENCNRRKGSRIDWSSPNGALLLGKWAR